MDRDENQPRRTDHLDFWQHISLKTKARWLQLVLKTTHECPESLQGVTKVKCPITILSLGTVNPEGKSQRFWLISPLDSDRGWLAMDLKPDTQSIWLFHILICILYRLSFLTSNLSQEKHLQSIYIGSLYEGCTSLFEGKHFNYLNINRNKCLSLHICLLSGQLQ